MICEQDLPRYSTESTIQLSQDGSVRNCGLCTGEEVQVEKIDSCIWSPLLTANTDLASRTSTRSGAAKKQSPKTFLWLVWLTFEAFSMKARLLKSGPFSQFKIWRLPLSTVMVTFSHFISRYPCWKHFERFDSVDFEKTYSPVSVSTDIELPIFWSVLVVPTSS